MTSATYVNVDPWELVGIVEAVFTTMMSLDVEPVKTPWTGSNDRVSSTVHLSGAWRGAVILECERDMACRCAGRFLSMEPPGAVDAEVRDVMGELVNMIGGNLKCVLTEGILLSMPSVVDGGDCSQHFCRSAVFQRVTFNSADGPFWVSVLSMRQ